LFGWRDGTMYMQAYEVMEDDSRNWSKDRQRLLAKLVKPQLRQSLAAHEADIDWQRVGDLAHTPRAVPVAITGGMEGVDSVVAQSQLVDNILPAGSNWDGKSGLLVDEKVFNDLVGARDKNPHAAPAQPEAQTQASVR